MKQKITIEQDGEATTHIAGGVPEYATLCGMDGNDPGISQLTVETPRGAKVNCVVCYSIWQEAKQWRASDFDDRVKT